MKTLLYTERLVVRRFGIGDWRDLKAYVAREDVMRFEPPHPTTDEGMQDLTIFFARSDEFWAVTRRNEPQVIGHIHCGPKEPREWGSYNLGFVFNPDFWHQGYATEAAAQVMAHAFESLGVRRIESGCNPENHASWRLLERLGMRREAHHLQNTAFRRDSTGQLIFTDSYEYALLREEWLSRRRRG